MGMSDNKDLNMQAILDDRFIGQIIMDQIIIHNWISDDLHSRSRSTYRRDVLAIPRGKPSFLRL